MYTVACYSHCMGWEVYIIQNETDKRYNIIIIILIIIIHVQ